MDKETRNRIQRATQDARALLEDEYSRQLDSVFDIRDDGTIAAGPGKHLDPSLHMLRSKLVTAVGHQLAGGMKKADAVAAYLREAAFTMLNRLVALKMLEARALVQECISRGDQSAGFKEFTGLAPGLVQVPDQGYRIFIESLFDEIGREVRVLFDRRDPASLLWPRRQPLFELLNILNDPDLAAVWGEDETIGWVYQYFNSDDERKRMRTESQAPRNSRELAVLNQFFTPRYVVQFLTDNTLGRIWYEMRQGETELGDLEHLVRRPNEVFLEEGQLPPPDADSDNEDRSADDELRRPIHVPFRPKKDPRDIRVLDPACGSGHFLLYAFDLLLTIYEEAWSDEAPSASGVSGRSLREDYPDVESLHSAVPGLILRHNLYGVDIDPRCAQIAALALWLRAQRSYKEFDVPRAARPTITRTSIVVAEPMPGDRELRRDFIATLNPRLGSLVERVFDAMEMAGVTGPLLRIEKEIADAVRETYRAHPGELLHSYDEERWSKAEADVLRALQVYAENATKGRSYERRLFAHDAARSLGFIELCRIRYDALLMNPPFGQPAESSKEYVSSRYATWSRNVLCAFVERAVELTAATTGSGYVGAVCDRTVNIKSTYEEFRRSLLLGDTTIAQVLDLGWGVLDANVEVSALTLGASSAQLLGFDVRGSDDKDAALRATLDTPTVKTVREVRSLPNAVIGYYFPDFVTRMFATLPSLAESGFDFFEGHTLKSDRYFRYFWELPPGTSVDGSARWVRLFNGAPYAPFYYPLCEVAPIGPRGSLASADPGSVLRNLNKHTVPGVCFGKRGELLDAQPLPAGFVSTVEGKACAEPDLSRAGTLLAVLNSALFQYVINLYCGQHKYSGYVGLFPFAGQTKLSKAAKIARQIADLKAACFSMAEFSPVFEGYTERVTDPDSVIRAIEEAEASLCEMESELDQAIFEAYQLTDRDVDIVQEYCERRPINNLLSRILGSASPRGDGATPMMLHSLLGLSFERCVPEVCGTSTGFQELYPTTSLGPAGKSARLLLVDDPGHPEDIISVTHEHARSVSPRPAMNELADRSWYRTNGFDTHLSIFSVGRRAAPIYWQLGVPSDSYSVWIYYHLLTSDTFYRVLNEYVTPKVKYEQNKLTDLAKEAGLSPSTSWRRELEAQERFVAELRGFSDEVVRVAPLWNPDLNDGVIINFAPLWRLVPQHGAWQKECKKVWDKLCKGDYDWANLAMHLWPERVVPKCAKDRSLAIAHGLEDAFWEQGVDGKWKPRKTDRATVNELIAERSSAAVKDALKSLLEAPTQTKARTGARAKATRPKKKRRTRTSSSAGGDA